MKHFKNNVLNEQSTSDAIDSLAEISGAIAVNAVMVAGGECELSKADAAAWWSLIALAEAALSRFPEKMSRDGYEVVNRLTDREMFGEARRNETERAAKHVVSVIICPKED